MSLINYVTRIHFAEHVLEDALEAELARLGIARPLIVCDDGGARPDVKARLLAALPRRVEATTFDASGMRSSEQSAETIARLYADAGSDGLVAFGSGPAMALAKATLLKVAHEGSLKDFAGHDNGRARIAAPLPPFLAIATAPGACADAIGVVNVTVVSGRNIALCSPRLTPGVVICDPTLTADLAPGPTASSGMDAFVHCIETFLSTAYNPPADGIAREGLRRAGANFEKAMRDGADIAARREMMAVAINGALAGQKGLGAVHAMSHALDSAVDGPIDHGAVNAILLPHVLAFNAPAIPERMAEMLRELGLPANAELPVAMDSLRVAAGMPGRLSQLGIRADDLILASELAESDLANRTNPRRATALDYRQMLEAAF